MVACSVLAGWGGATPSRERNHVVILALDVGRARIGVATSDESELLATPRTVIRRKSDALAIEAIVRAVAEAGAELVVVGLPVSFDAQLHSQAQTVRGFAEKLRPRLSVPLVYADETLSTVRAEEQLRASGLRADKIRERIDAAAAAVILQEYLDARRQPGTTRRIEDGDERTDDSARGTGSQP
jgi:putative Holliday junction resolvase